MIKHTEVMKMALEALGQLWLFSDETAVIANPAITALREALAQERSSDEQPAQHEPVLQDIEQYRLQMAGISTAAIGYWKESDGIHSDYDTIALRDVAKLYAKYDELYRAQRQARSADTWVGLTEESIWKEYQNFWPFHPAEEPTLAKDIVKFARAIEAALRSKNT